METILIRVQVPDDVIPDWDSLLLKRDGKFGISYDFEILKRPTDEEIIAWYKEFFQKKTKHPEYHLNVMAEMYAEDTKVVIDKIFGEDAE